MKCCIPDCGRSPIRGRGLYNRCYTGFMYWIRLGYTSWKEIERLKLSKPIVLIRHGKLKKLIQNRRKQKCPRR